MLLATIMEKRLTVATEEGIDITFYKDGLVEIKHDRKLVQFTAAQWDGMRNDRALFMDG